MRRRLSPWAMGFANAPLGFYFGYISTAIPILLSARGVSVDEISHVSGIAFSPSFWAFALCPVLEVRFSRRTYAIALAILSAVCLGLSTLFIAHLAVFTAIVTTGCVCAVMFGNAAGGWIADIISDRSYDHVGATSNIANLGAAGIFGAVAVVLIRTCSVTLSAWLLAAIVIAPLVLFPFIPPPGHATRTVSQAFETLWQDTKYACRRPGFVLVLIAFVSPTACFALTNLFSGMGADFHSSERAVTVLNGPLVAAVCSLGCVVGIPLCQRFKRRTVYVIAGFGGAAAALALIPTPHILAFYASGVLVYNFFQGINYTAFGALSFEVVGANNPFAATQYGLLAAAANLPISYMTVVDGHFHGSHGLTGLLGVDALSSIATGVALLMLFRWLARKRTPGPPTLETASAG